jgi:hypothetical protein
MAVYRCESWRSNWWRMVLGGRIDDAKCWRTIGRLGKRGVKGKIAN